MAARVQAFPPNMMAPIAEAEELRKVIDERERIARRIAGLRPYAVKRMELTIKLRELTARQLRLETETGKARI